MISLIDIIEQQLHGSAVDNDVMIVDEEIESLGVAQQTDAEQTVAIDIEWSDQRGLHCLNILNVFHMKRPRIDVGRNVLHRFAVVVEHDAGEKRGMRFHRCFNSFAQPVGIQAVVYCVQIW